MSGDCLYGGGVGRGGGGGRVLFTKPRGAGPGQWAGWWRWSTWAVMMYCLHPLLSLSFSPHLATSHFLPRLAGPWLCLTASCPLWWDERRDSFSTYYTTTSESIIFITRIVLHRTRTRTRTPLDCPTVPAAVWFGVSPHLQPGGKSQAFFRTFSLTLHLPSPPPPPSPPQQPWWRDGGGRMLVSVSW